MQIDYIDTRPGASPQMTTGQLLSPGTEAETPAPVETQPAEQRASLTAALTQKPPLPAAAVEPVPTLKARPFKLDDEGLKTSPAIKRDDLAELKSRALKMGVAINGPIPRSSRTAWS
jgi:hypothetical protein